jgi:hypothetical protein
MTELKHLIGEYWALIVPEDATDIQLHKVLGEDNYCVTLYSKEPMERTEKIYLNKPGSWSIVSISDEMTEAKMSQIVEMQKTFGYRDYMASNGDYQWTGLKQSFHSLLKAKQIDKRVLIIKKGTTEAGTK